MVNFPEFVHGKFTGLARRILQVDILRHEDNGRVRVEVSPYVIVDGATLTPVFATAGQIISDPANLKPERPVGHCYEQHLSPTRRWVPSEFPEIHTSITLMASNPEYPWELVYTDGGSDYFRGQFNLMARKQVARSSGRTMIGMLVPQSLTLQNDSGGQFVLKTYLQLRVVTDVGTDTKRSPQGTTQYAFGGFRE